MVTTRVQAGSDPLATAHSICTAGFINFSSGSLR